MPSRCVMPSARTSNECPPPESACSSPGPAALHSQIVGGVYEILVSRPADTVRIHSTPGPWLHQFPDRDAVARLEIADRTARDAVALLALHRKAAKNTRSTAKPRSVDRIGPGAVRHGVEIRKVPFWLG